MRMLLRISSICLPLLIGLCAMAAPDRIKTETVLATWERAEVEPTASGGATRQNYAFIRTSPHGARLTYVEHEANRERMVVNGTPGPWYDALLGGAVFTPDEKVVYAARTGQRYVVVYDGVASQEYDLVKTIAFTWWRPTSTQVIDALWQEDQSRKIDSAYAACLFQILPDGRVAYIARRDGQDRLLINGVEKGTYEKIGWLAYSPDGERMALAVQTGGKWRLVLDGRLQRDVYDELASEMGYQAFTFSFDSKHFAYQASVAGKQLVVIDGKVRKVTDRGIQALLEAFPRNTFGVFYYDVNPEPRQINDYPVLDDLIPIGRQEPVASILRDGRLKRLWVNGTASRPFTEVSSYLWYPMAAGIACVVKDGEKEMMLAGGAEGKRYDRIYTFRVSPDGKHLAYLAQAGDHQIVVLDGVEGAPYPKVDEYSLIFSADSAHLAYRVRHENSCTIVSDGSESPTYIDVSCPDFGPKGECAFVIKDGNASQAIVNALPGPNYDRIFDYRLFFDAPGKFHYFAKRGQEILRVDEVIQE